MELYLVVQVVLGGLLLAALVWGRDSLLWVSGFLIPLYGMSAFVGVRLTWDKAIPVALAIDLLVRGGAGRALRMPGRLPLFLLLGYTAIISGLVWWLDADAEHWRHVAKGLGWGAGQTDYRYLVQGSVFFQTWIMPVLGFCMVQSRKSFKSASGGFLWGASVSVGAGIYQAFARSLGLPWWDSAVADVAQGAMGVRERVQQFALGPISVDRLYGLGGEPKHTAVLTLVALCLVFALIVQGEKLRARVLVVCLLLVGLLLTFSTSGWVASLAVFSVVVFRGGGKAAGRLVGVVAVLFGVALLLVGPVAMFDLYDQRVSSRLYGEQSALEQEHKDGAFFAYVQDHPEKLLVGHGAGGGRLFSYSLRRPAYPPEGDVDYSDVLRDANGRRCWGDWSWFGTAGHLPVVGRVASLGEQRAGSVSRVRGSVVVANSADGSICLPVLGRVLPWLGRVVVGCRVAKE